ncbi:MAG: valine--tRNA ligase [Candidatus Marinimicrobia bacterium]|nr:valine--tRNA ligase [Candidatus Neomarinimicrobiota bacterium]
MKKEIGKIYDPKGVEQRRYKQWMENKYFHADPNSRKTPYTIVIPPPNVTAELHLGHAYNNTLQDVLIRYKKMNGFETLWMPGTDHAGIATQNVVEKQLEKEGLDRHKLGREKFVERVWKWKEEKGNKITEQLKTLGCACDWDRERFTMDEGLSLAVKEVFVSLYERDLIYRGKYIINWCPRCGTALSDEEAEHKEINGSLWHIKYRVEDSDDFVTVATTRPETMLGDTAVAINPKDDRYKDLIGKTVILPLLDRKLRVIEDSFVDPEFGTGVVKVTPAHDPNDFQMGKRHDLDSIQILNEDGTLNKNAGPYAGLDRFKARELVVTHLEEQNLLTKVEDHTYSVGHCYRCGTIVEPYLSTQWFVKIGPLAEKALNAVKSKEIKIHPAKWEKTYFHWMENIRDWCISRQLWWGHRIPAYHCAECGEIMVAREEPDECVKCSGKLKQDPDVLDTWFSSWLWPFSTLGWPEKTKELEYFYPTDTLVTGHEILFFWVARMIMSGLEFMEKIPFSDIYLHGVVRDESGRKMSKSLGNGIDPLKMVEMYSADAVRFSILSLAPEGLDIRINEKDFEIGRNFTNKIWNAFRFIYSNMDETQLPEIQSDNLELADRWILSRYNTAISAINREIEDFKISNALDKAYKFFWGEYCDWYLELIKERLYSEDKERKDSALAVAVTVLKGAMQLLHPFVPFVTEEVYSTLSGEESIMLSAYPESNEKMKNSQAEEEMTLIQELSTSVRTIRSQMSVPPSVKGSLIIVGATDAETKIIENNRSYMENLCKLESISFNGEVVRDKLAATDIVRNIELIVPLEGLIDTEVEAERLNKDLENVEKALQAVNKKLSDKSFLQNAPADIVEKERQKEKDFSAKISKIKTNLEWLTKAS